MLISGLWGKNDGLAILSYHVSNTLHLHACCISIIAISLSWISQFGTKKTILWWFSVLVHFPSF